MTTAMRQSALSAEDDRLTGTIIGVALRVHKQLGPGFLESIYHNAMRLALARAGLVHTSEQRITIDFEGTKVGEQRLDLMIEGRVVVEIKAVEALAPIHRAQLIAYLRGTDLRIGLLLNFNGVRLEVKRVLNGYDRGSVVSP
jgi:GxxExxY protein